MNQNTALLTVLTLFLVWFFFLVGLNLGISSKENRLAATCELVGTVDEVGNLSQWWECPLDTIPSSIAERYFHNVIE